MIAVGSIGVEVGEGEGNGVKVGANVGDGGGATGNNWASSAPIRRRWSVSSTRMKLYWLQNSINLVSPTPIT